MVTMSSSFPHRGKRTASRSRFDTGFDPSAAFPIANARSEVGCKLRPPLCLPAMHAKHHGTTGVFQLLI
jgi:hypothetical protein